MKFSKFALGWAGLAFFGFGWAYLIWPQTMIALSGMQIPTPVAVTDARAMYGGYQIGFGAFLLYCAFCSRWTWPGLIATLGAFGGIVVCRMVGFVLDGSAGEYHLSALALIEVPGVLFAAIGLCRERSCCGEDGASCCDGGEVESSCCSGEDGASCCNGGEVESSCCSGEDGASCCDGGKVESSCCSGEDGASCCNGAQESSSSSAAKPLASGVKLLPLK